MMKTFRIFLWGLKVFLIASTTLCQAQKSDEEDLLGDLVALRRESVDAYVSKIVSGGKEDLKEVINQIATESDVYQFYVQKTPWVVNEMFLVLGLDFEDRVEVLEVAIDTIKRGSVEESTRATLSGLVNSYIGTTINGEIVVDDGRALPPDWFMARLDLWNMMSQVGRETVIVGGFVAEGSDPREVLDQRINALTQRDVDLLAIYTYLGVRDRSKSLGLFGDLLRLCEEAGFNVLIPDQETIDEFVATATNARRSNSEPAVAPIRQGAKGDQAPTIENTDKVNGPKIPAWFWTFASIVVLGSGVAFFILRTRRAPLNK